MWLTMTTKTIFILTPFCIKESLLSSQHSSPGSEYIYDVFIISSYCFWHLFAGTFQIQNIIKMNSHEWEVRRGSVHILLFCVYDTCCIFHSFYDSLQTKQNILLSILWNSLAKQIEHSVTRILSNLIVYHIHRRNDFRSDSQCIEIWLLLSFVVGSACFN